MGERERERASVCAHCKCCCNRTRESKRVSIHHDVLYDLRQREAKTSSIETMNRTKSSMSLCWWYIYALCIHTFDALTHTNFRSYSLYTLRISLSLSHICNLIQHLCTWWNDAISFSSTIRVFWHMDAVCVCAVHCMHHTAHVIHKLYAIVHVNVNGWFIFFLSCHFRFHKTNAYTLYVHEFGHEHGQTVAIVLYIFLYYCVCVCVWCIKKWIRDYTIGSY